MSKFRFNCGIKTQLAAIMSAESPNEAIAQARAAEYNGADGITIDLAEYKPEFRNKDSFASIFNSVQIPFMVYFYRNDKCNSANTDDERQEVLIAAAEAGAAMIDVMGDLYAPEETTQRTLDTQAVQKQKMLIQKIHDLGSEVVMSSHTKKFLNSIEVLEQLQDFASRGADVVKCVIPVDTDEEFIESVRTNLMLTRKLTLPYIFLAGGKFSRIQRYLGLALGNSITFAVNEFNPRMPMSQPSLDNFKDIRNALHWNARSICAEDNK